MEVEYVIGLSGTFAHALPTTYSMRIDTHSVRSLGHTLVMRSRLEEHKHAVS